MEIKIGPSESIRLPSARPGWSTAHRLRRFGTSKQQAVQIRLSEHAFTTVDRHAISSENEIGGVLIGEAFESDGEYFIDVTEAIAGEMTQAGPAHVTFTAETWAELLRKQEELYPEQRIVGWYHSHPRMGIFLSGMDLTIHENFFPQPWHVALVVNGQDQKAGFFVWHEGRIEPAGSWYWYPSLWRRQRFEIFPVGSRFDYRQVDTHSLEPETPIPGFTPRWLFWGAALLGFWVISRWIYGARRRKRRGRVDER